MLLAGSVYLTLQSWRIAWSPDELQKLHNAPSSKLSEFLILSGYGAVQLPPTGAMSYKDQAVCRTASITLVRCSLMARAAASGSRVATASMIARCWPTVSRDQPGRRVSWY